MKEKEIKKIFKTYRLKPIKRLGQNFLVKSRVLKKILKISNLNKEEVVLEIGAGLGNLTKELAKNSKKVIALEKDCFLAKILEKDLGEKEINNVKVVNEDVFRFLSSNEEMKKLRNYKVVANIPYYLTSRLIKTLLELKNKPKEIILTVQKEVAQRICAKEKLSLLALSVQFYAQAKIIELVPKESFWPQPKVDSAIIKITPLTLSFPNDFVHTFFKILKAGFRQPRKKILNNLSKNLNIEKEKVKIWLLENKILEYRRPENLTLENWINLAKNFKIK